MGTARPMIRVSSFLVLGILLLLAACGSDSSHKKDPVALSVIFTSPSWNVTIPQGQSVSFIKEVTGGVSPFTYAWDFDGGANSTTVEDPGQVVFDTPGAYTVKLTVTDSAGVSASASVLVTVQEKAADKPPCLRYTVPEDGATDVGTTTTIQIIFTPIVDLSTVTDSTFMLHIGGAQVPGIVSTSDQVATFTPLAGLLTDTLYTATLTTGVKDIVGNDLFAADYTWTFSTIGYTLSAAILSPSGNVTIMEGESVPFQGSATGGRPPYTFKWSFSADIPPSEDQIPGLITFSTRGTYTVVLRVYDADGHVSYALRSVNVYSTTEGDWTQVTAGRGHTLALKSNNTLWAWGSNTYGQLGNGTLVNRYSPVQIGSSIGWSSVSAGADHTLALKPDGTLWAWGRNGSGQLGDGTNTDRTTPVQVGTESTWARIAAGYGHSLAMKDDGTVWAWGLNSSGQLGDATLIDKNYPVQVGPASDWTFIAAGYAHSLAVKNDGTLWSWGLNEDGQLGDGTEVPSNVPAVVGSENGWVAAAAGYGHSIAYRQDGTLIAWGEGSHGQLGNGNFDDSLTPVLVGTDSLWSSVAATHKHSVAIKKDGSLWAWGFNETVSSATGQSWTGQSRSDSGGGCWESVATGWGHTGAIKKGGTLWMWGNNTSGQLGDKSMTTRMNPVQVKW